jgi:hypothetical protein
MRTVKRSLSGLFKSFQLPQQQNIAIMHMIEKDNKTTVVEMDATNPPPM